MINTNYDWEKWGQQDPYFGVITDEKYRSGNITESIKLDFFESGIAHVEHVLSVCKKHFDPNFIPKRALDFGCGVGRLVIPLAAIANEVVGLDISEAMLKEAIENCKERQIENVDFLKSDDDLSALDGEFDFIHSYIVLQHIPISRGKRIFLKLIEHLSEDGIAAIHVTYSKSRYSNNFGLPKVPWLNDLLKNSYKTLKHYWSKIFQHIEAPMQMNTYHLNEILFLIKSAGATYSVSEFTNHGGELGVLLYFQKSSKNYTFASKL
jgi:2-polyprenyl-3-methyl-5-hydroxy-6-metoxy-1,4-benzoquinol methylase